MIKQHVNWAKTQTGKKVKSFFSEKGKDFKCTEVSEFFKSKGIEQIEISSYSLQSNGIAEKDSNALPNGQMFN